MTLAPGIKLGPYEILAPIGAGGMGEVYKARDTRLGRIVAIKKVKEQHSERFKQEARSIAALNHQFICQLHDIGPDYLVLEYVEGKPLSSPLPEKEAVRLAIQIATALEEAHRNGVIHRDLKPSNIMVTDRDSVKLLDFGLAKLYEQDASISTSPTVDFPATQAGAVLGTVAYMSPEQAQGQPPDARSDIFSFGLVLYEMLSGRRAFAGDSNYAIMNAIVKEDPPSIQTSPSLEKIVRQCLAKHPSGRYQTMSQVKAALEQVYGEKSAMSSAEQQPSIAVLPFVNMSGDKEQEYFSDGLAEEIINALTQIPGLIVIARTSAFAFKGKEEDITKIAEALRVSTILEGSVRKAGNRIRITAQLIDAARGSHLWSQRYDREMTDVFAIQDEIAQAIAEKLRLKLAAGPLAKRYTRNLEAYNVHLKARYHFYKFTSEGFDKAKEYYEQAIAADPSCAQAWSGLAVFYWFLGFTGAIPPRPANALCSQAAVKALELDETLPEAHSVAGMLRAIAYDWKGAEQQFRRALELGPEVSEVLWQYSNWYLLPMRRLDEAVTMSQKAVEYDPLSPFLHFNLGIRYFMTRQYDQAIQQYQNALELDPNYAPALYQLAVAYLQNGKLDKANQIIGVHPKTLGSPVIQANRVLLCARTGQTGEVESFLRQLQETPQGMYVSAIAFAIAYFALGQIEKCFDWLDKAVEEHEPIILQMAFNPLYDPLRSHPRYRALLRKMNLEP
jgi:eukaryotic-like serine/threonine-protein kinase